MRVTSIRLPRVGGIYERSIKKLAKTYPHIEHDIGTVLTKLLGTTIPAPPSVLHVPGLARFVLKVRVASTDMQVGKSGGFRVLLVDVGIGDWQPFLVYAKVRDENLAIADILDAIACDAPDETTIKLN